MKFGIRDYNTGRYTDPARAIASAWTVEHTIIEHGYQSAYPVTRWPVRRKAGVAGLKCAASGIEGVLAWKNTIEQFAAR